MKVIHSGEWGLNPQSLSFQWKYYNGHKMSPENKKIYIFTHSSSSSLRDLFLFLTFLSLILSGFLDFPLANTLLCEFCFSAKACWYNCHSSADTSVEPVIVIKEHFRVFWRNTYKFYVYYLLCILKYQELFQYTEAEGTQC